MSEFDDVQRLLRLKRHERPPDGYFDDFVVEFQRRQRAALLKQSSRGLFIERFGTWLSGFGRQRLLLGAGIGYATAMLVFFMGARGPQASPSSASQAPAPERVSSLLLPAVPAAGDSSDAFGGVPTVMPGGRAPWYRPVTVEPPVYETEDGRKIIEF